MVIRMIPLIGDILLRQTTLSEENLADALSFQEQQAPEKRIGQVLVETGQVGEDDLCRALAEQWELAYVEEIPAESASRELLQSLPIEFLRKHGILPFQNGEDEVTIAVTDPLDTMAIDSVINAIGRPCTVVLSRQSVPLPPSPLSAVSTASVTSLI